MYETYDTYYSLQEIARVVDKLDRALKGEDRGLVIATLLVYVLTVSDPDMAKNPQQLILATKNLSEHICFLTSMPLKIDPKDAN